jgi:signal-transduction protein with cAMP-binding, CBS, and nucleotidyltransferase domain
MQVRSMTTKQPVTVSEDTPVQRVAEIMNAEVVGAVVVTRDDVPVGIVTDRDLAVRVVGRWGSPADLVGRVMSPDVVTLDANADDFDALAIFEQHDFRRLPLVEHGKLVGLIALDDLVVDLVSRLQRATTPITGQVVFGGPEPEPMVNQ